MKALVISPQPFFSPRGTPFSVYYRTLVTAEAGIEVDLLTYGDGADVDIPGVRIIRIPRFPMLGEPKIGPSFVKLFLDLFLIVWTVALLLRHRYDFVHAHEEAVFYCRFLKPLFGFKLIYDMHSSLPQQLTNFKFTTSKFLIGIFKMLEDSSLKASDAVITICPDLRNYVNGQVFKNRIRERHKHLMIENSIFDPVRLKTNNNAAKASDIGVSPEKEAVPVPTDRPLVVYAGTLEPYQGIHILLAAFKAVIAKIPDAFLLVVGGSPVQVEKYSAMAAELGIADHCTFTGRVPQIMAKYYCGLADVQMSPRCEGTNTPLKVYEQLASGIPLVATRIYSHTQVLDDSVAFMVEPEPDDMARGIVRALTSEADRKRIAQNARNLYEEAYSRPVYEWKMGRILETVADRRREG